MKNPDSLVEKREPYVAIIRTKGNDYAIFANNVDGDLKTDKFITVGTTNKEGKKRKITIAVETIAEYEENLNV